MSLNFSWDPQFELGLESAQIAADVWPRFLAEPSDLVESDLAFEIDELEFKRRFPAWGLRDSESRRLLAYANAVMVNIDLKTDVLPDRGWEFAIESGARALIPNCLCLVVANVDPSVQGLGLSKLLIDKAKVFAHAAGFTAMVAPVRPSHFHEVKHNDFEAYVRMRRVDGLMHDPWLRAHERAGGQMLNVCWNSSIVKATPSKWSEWTGQVYPKTRHYSLVHGFTHLEIDLDRNIGTYAEPNVWFKYEL